MSGQRKCSMELRERATRMAGVRLVLLTLR